jgi:hypothetical protein
MMFLEHKVAVTSMTVYPCHHNMASPQVADEGECLQTWTVAANILNKQVQTAEEGWSSSLQIGHSAYKSSPQKLNRLQNISQSLRLRLVLWNNISTGKWT